MTAVLLIDILNAYLVKRRLIDKPLVTIGLKIIMSERLLPQVLIASLYILRVSLALITINTRR